MSAVHFCRDAALLRLKSKLVNDKKFTYY